MNNNLYVHIAAFTHPGRIRPYNEDCIAVGTWLHQGIMDQAEQFILPLEQPLLCLVADGLGGHAAGEVASRYAAQRLSAAVADLGNDEQAISDCLQRINAEIQEEMQTHPNQIGMGTTVAGLIITSEGIVAFNVGDSRIYRYWENCLDQVSIDDTPEAIYGLVTSFFRSHIITQCLGGLDNSQEIEPHIVPQPLEIGCLYLLCSDGLTDMVNLYDLETSLSDDLQQTAITLFKKAMFAGGNDNFSIVLVRVERAER